MLTEPPLDRERLIAQIARSYGIDVRRLEFVPVGFEAACYVLHGEGDRWFLKAWPDIDPAGEHGRRIHGSLALAAALFERSLYPYVPHPLRTTRGALWENEAGYPFAIAPYIAGWMPPEVLPVELATPFGQSVATLHAATKALAELVPVRDPFWLYGGQPLEPTIERLRRTLPGANPTHARLADAVLPRASELLAAGERLAALEPRVRGLDTGFVLCHGDLGGDNLIVGDTGELYHLDWDWAGTGPPEHDLWAAIGPAFPGVVEAYHQAGGTRSLHLLHFEFFLVRRALGDLLARVERLLDRTQPMDDDEELLRGIDAYGFQRLDSVDNTLTDIAAAL